MPRIQDGVLYSSSSDISESEDVAHAVDCFLSSGVIPKSRPKNPERRREIRQTKRHAASAIPINLQKNRSEFLVPSEKSGHAMRVLNDFNRKHNLQCVNGMRQNACMLCLITIIGPQDSRLKLKKELQKDVKFQVLKGPDSDPGKIYCGVCYSQGHKQKDCKQCSYCCSEEHMVNDCIAQTVAFYELGKSKACELRALLEKISWRAPVRITYMPKGDNVFKFMCRILGNPKDRAVQYNHIRALTNNSVKFAQISARGPFQPYCVMCLTIGHSLSSYTMKCTCGYCIKVGHSSEDCPQMTLIVFDLYVLEGIKSVKRHQNIKTNVYCNYSKKEGLLVLRGTEKDRYEAFSQHVKTFVPMYANVKRGSDKDPPLIHCTHCASVSEHWAKDCGILRDMKETSMGTEATEERLSQNFQQARNKRRREDFRQRLQPLVTAAWKEERFVADFTHFRFKTLQDELEEIPENRRREMEEPEFLAVDIEKVDGLQCQWAVCIAIVAFFSKRNTVEVAYFSYVNNTHRAKRGLDFSSVTLMAAREGIDPDLAKRDVLQLLKNKDVYFHTFEYDMELMGIEKNDWNNHGIKIYDVADSFRDEIGCIGLKDIVYTHFRDKYGRQKKIQEYHDDFVALGGHNAEIDARYTAKIAHKIRKGQKLLSPSEIRNILKDEVEIGAIFKVKKRKLKKIPPECLD